MCQLCLSKVLISKLMSAVQDEERVMVGALALDLLEHGGGLLGAAVLVLLLRRDAMLRRRQRLLSAPRTLRITTEPMMSAFHCSEKHQSS